eukprot:COSAG06_NODE_6718_length_2811_cov_3.835546_4_plen_119_part_00
MDVDNLTFALLLPEKLHTVVKTHGQIELTDAQTKAIAQTKPVHVFLIVFAVFIDIVWVGWGDIEFMAVPMVFGLGGMIEVVSAGYNYAQLCREIAKMFIAATLGFLVTGLFLLLGTVR